MSTVHTDASGEQLITIEREAFNNLMQTSVLFEFLIGNIGRLSMGLEGDPKDPKLVFALNPPGRRQQFLREDVIRALVEVKQRLSVPQYGVN